VLGTFGVPVKAYGAICVGSTIWIANDGGNSVTKLRTTDGSVLRTIPVGLNPEAFAFDGSSVWVTNSRSQSVTKILASGDDGIAKP
jgi:DNA-binding beta-propeller fold protein YncE